jgi:DNA replication protein DnaC
MDIAGSIGKGVDVGWVMRPCKYCGGEARFPEGLFGNSVFANIPAICDDCEKKDRVRIASEMLRTDPAELFERSGAPNCPPCQLHYQLGNFVNDDKRGVFVFGAPGTYKTSSAAQMVRAWSKQRGVPSVYTRERAYFEACWDNDRATVDRLRKAPLLIIDDLGTDHESDWSAGLFYDLVDCRYQSNKKTVWISNLPIGQLAGFKHFDGRVIRRIAEMCGQPLEMT